ncbi:MAG: type II toxin-antitoxin system death-on-curing family toxin [Pseudomonadota bacterium]
METKYLALEQVLAIHSKQIEKFGGSAGIRDAGLIEAALLRPQTGYYSDVLEEAAALWESLAMNHGFVDGNKRVAFACVFVFLGLNGLKINTSSAAATEFILGNLEAGTFTKDVLDGWLRENTSRR